MNRFVIVDGLPYLYADGRTYRCRWDEKGFTVGEDAVLVSVPAVTHSEQAVFAKCRVVDSIAAGRKPGDGRRKKQDKEREPC